MDQAEHDHQEVAWEEGPWRWCRRHHHHLDDPGRGAREGHRRRRADGLGVQLPLEHRQYCVTTGPRVNGLLLVVVESHGHQQGTQGWPMTFKENDF